MGIYKVNDNGVIRDMTPDEIAGLTAQEPRYEKPKQKSDAERITSLEEKLKATEILLGVSE